MSLHNDTVSRAVAVLASESTAPEIFHPLIPTWLVYAATVTGAVMVLVGGFTLSDAITKRQRARDAKEGGNDEATQKLSKEAANSFRLTRYFAIGGAAFAILPQLFFGFAS